jgi:chitin disaccharide deacetylase
MVSERRMLIVNADDFGLNNAVNAGIVRAYDHGIVSSASLMVRRPGAAAAARAAAERGRLSVGLHIDFGDWRYDNGQWILSERPDAALDESVAVAREMARQIQQFRELTGRDPTHLDSHHHVHLQEPLRRVAQEWSAALDVPLRSVSGGVVYRGEFHGQSGRGEAWPAGITTDALGRIIASVAPGTTELGCHPGDGAAGASVYDAERSVERAVLCDPAVFAALADEAVELVSFGTPQNATEPSSDDSRTGRPFGGTKCEKS